MIFNTDLNFKRNAMYDSTKKNLENALQLLEKRFQNKEISSEEYIKKSKEIKSEIEKIEQFRN